MLSAVRALPKNGSFRLATLALGAGLIVLAFPQVSREAAWFALTNLAAVSPVIALGVVLTAGATASGSMALITGAFHGRELRMIGLVSLIGALTPVCGVTVLPLVAGLLAAGVPLAPIMAFWLSSPITDPGMLAVTAATLGLPFAIGKTLAAFLIGIAGGLVTLTATRGGWFAHPSRERAASAFAPPCTGTGDDRVNWRFWREPERRALFRDTAVATARLMLIWLSIAFVAEHFLHAWLPADTLGQLVGAGNRFAVPLAALVGAPLYLDGYAALPLIRGLMDAGMGAPAAMTFLIAGGIISAWAAIPVFALVRLPVFTLYVAMAVAGAMLAGWGFALVAP